MSIRPHALIALLGAGSVLLSVSCNTTAKKASSIPPPPPIQETASDKSQTPVLQQATLTVAGSAPFHLKALITERGDPNYKGEIEMFWVASDKWHRTIHAADFSQTLIVNGNKVFEEDGEDYFPLGLQTLAVALVDPKPVLDAFRPGDRLVTKANRGATNGGLGPMIVGNSRYGLIETVGSAGHTVDFTGYREFNGKMVARQLFYQIDPGDSLRAEVTELEELKNPDVALFAAPNPTSKARQLHSQIMSEEKLRGTAVESPEIVWPQVLDGAITGTSTYYISLDRSGQVREVMPVRFANERANDSAMRQLMKWRFKPVLSDGIPVQGEGLLTFNINTRAWGPADTLSDAEVRKLVTGLTEPDFGRGAVPGATKKLRIAVDHEGNVIEVIASDGPPELFGPCYDALKKWHFNPIMENGQPRPYRAEIECRVP